jgi:hypothetical protein
LSPLGVDTAAASLTGGGLSVVRSMVRITMQSVTTDALRELASAVCEDFAEGRVSDVKLARRKLLSVCLDKFGSLHTKRWHDSCDDWLKIATVFLDEYGDWQITSWDVLGHDVAEDLLARIRTEDEIRGRTRMEKDAI